jgi:hypothetical protein
LGYFHILWPAGTQLVILNGSVRYPNLFANSVCVSFASDLFSFKRSLKPIIYTSISEYLSARTLFLKNLLTRTTVHSIIAIASTKYCSLDNIIT